MKQQENTDRINGEQLEEVEKYNYLERLLSPENEMTREINERITSTWNRFGQYISFLEIPKDIYIPKKGHGHCHTTSNNIQSREVLAIHQRDKLAVT